MKAYAQVNQAGKAACGALLLLFIELFLVLPASGFNFVTDQCSISQLRN
jgi:hypothetical protein